MKNPISPDMVCGERLEMSEMLEDDEDDLKMPLLTSKQQMKKFRCKIDLTCDRLTILGETIQMLTDHKNAHYQIEKESKYI